MQYMLLIYGDTARFEDPQARQEMVQQHGALIGQLGPVFKGGSGLESPSVATTVRSRDGVQSINDGPFAEAREQLGGYYLIDVPDLDAALAIAKRVPLGGDGSVEVRPLLNQ